MVIIVKFFSAPTRNASKDEIWCVGPGRQLCLWLSHCFACPGPPSSICHYRESDQQSCPCGESDCDLELAQLIIPPRLPGGRRGVCQGAAQGLNRCVPTLLFTLHGLPSKFFCLRTKALDLGDENLIRTGESSLSESIFIIPESHWHRRRIEAPFISNTVAPETKFNLEIVNQNLKSEANVENHKREYKNWWKDWNILVNKS